MADKSRSLGILKAINQLLRAECLTREEFTELVALVKNSMYKEAFCETVRKKLVHFAEIREKESINEDVSENAINPAAAALRRVAETI